MGHTLMNLHHNLGEHLGLGLHFLQYHLLINNDMVLDELYQKTAASTDLVAETPGIREHK